MPCSSSCCRQGQGLFLPFGAGDTNPESPLVPFRVSSGLMEVTQPGKEGFLLLGSRWCHLTNSSAGRQLKLGISQEWSPDGTSSANRSSLHVQECRVQEFLSLRREFLPLWREFLSISSAEMNNSSGCAQFPLVRLFLLLLPEFVTFLLSSSALERLLQPSRISLIFPSLIPSFDTHFP